jgi:hypothetical protein
MPQKELFPWESFPYRLELKDRVAWFQCQEHMDREISRYKLKPRDYKASCKRGYKIVKPEKPKRKTKPKADIVKPKAKVVKPAPKPKPVDKKCKELLSPVMKFKTIQFDKKPKLLHPKRK